MKIVIATTPAPGHVNPMLGIARVLLAEGHEVFAFTGRAFEERIEAIGATFRPIPASADQDVVDPFSKYPEFKTLPPGLELLRIILERLFVDHIPTQHHGLQEVLQEVPADVVIGDDCFLGYCRCSCSLDRAGHPSPASAPPSCIGHGKTERPTF
ncbi:glycosyltransferase [Bradyrhizobium sp. JR7.2]|uniref:glycosyltransferase n=1 Tax=Bradyrhizobium sp. JR7.2 TaxID=3156375 RepID=UPI003396AE5D